MILLSLFLQFFALFIGTLLAKRVLATSTTIYTFEDAYAQSKTLWVVSFFSITMIVVNAIAFHYDAFFLIFPLLYQKYAMPLTWVVIVAYVAFISSFTLYITHKREAKKFKAYLSALLTLNILILLNHYQKNFYDEAFLKESNSTEPLVRQSSGFSCTSASVTTVARALNITTTEKRVAQLSRLTTFGASSGQVRYALEKLGIKHHSLTGGFNDPNSIKAPAILYVDDPTVGFEGHAIVYFGKNSQGYAIWNPLGFDANLSEEELREIWHGKGVECSIP